MKNPKSILKISKNMINLELANVSYLNGLQKRKAYLKKCLPPQIHNICAKLQIPENIFVHQLVQEMKYSITIKK